jgi:hypothetical protein
MRWLAYTLLLLSACPERWDPDAPPGVSRGRVSAGAEGEEDETEADSHGRPPAQISAGDQSLEGELAPGDHVLEVDGTLYDELAFMAVEGASIVITMRSAAFDPYLHLIGPDGRQIAHGGVPPGESTTGLAELIVVAPTEGEYRVYANAVAPEMRGAYELRLVVESPPSAREPPP